MKVVTFTFHGGPKTLSYVVERDTTLVAATGNWYAILSLEPDLTYDAWNGADEGSTDLFRVPILSDGANIIIAPFKTDFKILRGEKIFLAIYATGSYARFQLFFEDAIVDV